MHRLLSILAILICFGFNILAQANSNSAKTWELPVSFSKDGTFQKVSSQDIEIFENEKQIPLLKLTSSDEPLSIGLIVDMSGSAETSKIVANMRNALEELVLFIDSSNPKNEYFLTVIHKDHYVTSASNVDQARAKSLISGLAVEEPKGNTPFFDALASSLARITSGNNRKMIIALTDGDDTTSTKNNFGDVTDLLQRADVTFFGVNFGQIPNTPRVIQGEENLKQFCDLSGGKYISANDKRSWLNWGKTIADELANRYVAHIQLKATEGKPKWRKLKIRLTNDAKRALGEPQIRARKGIVF